jgi:hypothetical protein
MVIREDYDRVGVCLFEDLPRGLEARNHPVALLHAGAFKLRMHRQKRDV